MRFARRRSRITHSRCGDRNLLRLLRFCASSFCADGTEVVGWWLAKELMVRLNLATSVGVRDKARGGVALYDNTVSLEYHIDITRHQGADASGGLCITAALL